MRRLSLSLVLLAAGGALLVTAALAATSGQTAKGGTLRLGVPVDVKVDPALAISGPELALEYATCAKLFNFPDAAGEAATRVIPEVVDRYVVSRDGKTYTFDLKRTFRFHTGAPVTAQSFADAFNRDANPKMRALAANFMHEIVGADDVIAGKTTTISGIRVLAPYRLRIRLTKPVGDLVTRLTMAYFCPLLPNTPIDPGGIDDPPGGGPYYVAEAVISSRRVLAAS